jgi:hypothetical protein
MELYLVDFVELSVNLALFVLALPGRSSVDFRFLRRVGVGESSPAPDRSCPPEGPSNSTSSASMSSLVMRRLFLVDLGAFSLLRLFPVLELSAVCSGDNLSAWSGPIRLEDDAG